MRFVLFVEGRTERKAVADFLRRWLNPQLRQPVGFAVVKFQGWPEYLKEIRFRTDLTFRSSAARDIIAAIGLLDLSGPDFYPKRKRSAAERYEWAKEDIEKRVGNARFRQYFAVHEFEAWLLATPSVFPRAVRDALPARCAHPENVNFGEPPSQLLSRIYLRNARRAYRKAIDGPNLFLDADPSRAYAVCPLFRRMLDDILQLAVASVGAK